MANLTGRRRHRRNWRGKLILQVEEEQYRHADLNGSGHYEGWTVKKWRDARFTDIFEESHPHVTP